MPEVKHTFEVQAPAEVVWTRISDMSYWASLIPGYVSHELVDERESLWTVKGDLGILNKTVTFRVTITEWDEPAKVGFTLKATNENVAGDGYFLAEPTGPDSTMVTGYLDLQPGGRLAPVVNVFMKQLMPKTTLDFAKALANKIEGEYRSQG